MTISEFVRDNPTASAYITFFGVLLILNQLFGFHGWFLLVAILSYILVTMWADDEKKKRRELLIKEEMRLDNEPHTDFEDAEVGDQVYLYGRVNSTSFSSEVNCINVSLLGDCPQPLQVNIYMPDNLYTQSFVQSRDYYSCRGYGFKDGETVEAIGVKTNTREMIARRLSIHVR